MSVVQNDILECAARMEFDASEDVVNVFQFEYQSVAPLTDQQGVDDVIEFLEAIYTIVRIAMVVLTTFRDIAVTNTTQGLAYGAFPWPTLVAGAELQDPMVPGSAMLSNFATLTPGVQLRKYWGVLSEGHTGADALFTAAALAQLAPANALMLIPFVATNGTWQFGHFSSVPLPPAFITPTAAVVSAIPAYQRRRKQGRGS